MSHEARAAIQEQFDSRFLGIEEARRWPEDRQRGGGGGETRPRRSVDESVHRGSPEPVVRRTGTTISALRRASRHRARASTARDCSSASATAGIESPRLAPSPPPRADASAPRACSFAIVRGTAELLARCVGTPVVGQPPRAQVSVRGRLDSSLPGSSSGAGSARKQ